MLTDREQNPEEHCVHGLVYQKSGHSKIESITEAF